MSIEMLLSAYAGCVEWKRTESQYTWPERFKRHQRLMGKIENDIKYYFDMGKKKIQGFEDVSAKISNVLNILENKQKK